MWNVIWMWENVTFFFIPLTFSENYFFLLLSQSWSYSEEPLAGSKLLTCVFSALMVAEFIAIKDRVAELLGHSVVLGHQKELGRRVGRTKGFQDKWVEEPGCKRYKRKWGLWEETWALCSGLWAVGGLSESQQISNSALLSNFCMLFTSSLWNSHFPAAPPQQSQPFPSKSHTAASFVRLRQRNHECGQSDFWKYFSSSECIPRGISFALKDLGLRFKMNQLMIHLNYFKSFIHFSRFYQLSGKVMIPYS